MRRAQSFYLDLVAIALDLIDCFRFGFLQRAKFDFLAMCDELLAFIIFDELNGRQLGLRLRTHLQ